MAELLTAQFLVVARLKVARGDDERYREARLRYNKRSIHLSGQLALVELARVLGDDDATVGLVLVGTHTTSLFEQCL